MNIIQYFYVVFDNICNLVTKEGQEKNAILFGLFDILDVY